MKHLWSRMLEKLKFAKIAFIAVCFCFILSVGTGCASPQANSHTQDAQTLLAAKADSKPAAGSIKRGIRQDIEEQVRAESKQIEQASSASEAKAEQNEQASAAVKTNPNELLKSTDAISSSPPAPSGNKESAPSPIESSPNKNDSVAGTPIKSSAVEVSITGDKKHGVILKGTTVAFEAGTTVFDLLQKVTKANKIQMEFKGRGTFVYIQGIDNLYEFDEGAKSGWVYKVNGQVPDKGAGAYKISENDKIEWLYTLDMGKDVGVKLK